MKEYKNPYTLISDCYGAVLDILTEEEKEYLNSVLDFECIVLRVHDGFVDIVDSISEEIYNTETVPAFIRNSIKFAFHDCEKDEF